MSRLFRGIWRLIKGIFRIIFTLILIGIGIFIDARYIEPKLLTVKEQTIVTNKLTLKEPLKIVQFSDVHLGKDYTLGDFKKVISKINGLEPDLIIFTGDLIDNNKSFDQEQGTIALLKELRATYGKFAVYGNHDHGGNGTKRYARMMEQSDFVLLKDKSKQVTLSDGQNLMVIGIDDIVLGHPNIQKTLQEINPNTFNLFISHAPDVIEGVKNQPIDLQLSGHSHGGQVRIPFLGAPFTPPFGEKYVKGLYQIDESKGMTLYVNPGIGTSQVPYRFMNLPEITLLYIQNE